MALCRSCCQVVHFVLLEQSSGTVEDVLEQSARAAPHQDHRIVVVDDDVLALSVGCRQSLAQHVSVDGVIQVDLDVGGDADDY